VEKEVADFMSAMPKVHEKLQRPSKIQIVLFIGDQIHSIYHHSRYS